jgi:hypothetical protein
MAVAQGDAVRELKMAGHDLSGIPISRLPVSFEKVAFLCVNSYVSYRHALGVIPINDAVAFAKCVKTFGFAIYFFHNPHARNFLKYLEVFLNSTTKQLILYYVGPGIKDGAPDTTGEDVAFSFDDGPISDGDFLAHISEQKVASNQLTLITDTGRSGSVWDLHAGNARTKRLPPGIVSIWASKSSTPENQTVPGIDEGVFTHNLTKTLAAEPLITPSDLGGKLKSILKRYRQSSSVGTTTPALLNRSIFPPK